MSPSRGYYGISVRELLEAFTQLGMREYAVLIGIAMALLVLAVPLRGVDRRDQVAGFTYMLFCCAAGVTLTLALPVRLANVRDAAGQLAVVTLFAVVAGARWAWRRPRVVRVVAASERKSDDG